MSVDTVLLHSTVLAFKEKNPRTANAFENLHHSAHQIILAVFTLRLEADFNLRKISFTKKIDHIPEVVKNKSSVTAFVVNYDQRVYVKQLHV